MITNSPKTYGPCPYLSIYNNNNLYELDSIDAIVMKRGC